MYKEIYNLMNAGYRILGTKEMGQKVIEFMRMNAVLKKGRSILA